MARAEHREPGWFSHHRLVLPWRERNTWRRNRTLPRLYSGRRVGPMNQPVTWGPPPAERADATRNRRLLLATARDMLAEQGADKLTMDGLAERAGLGKGTVFRRFGTRAGIFAALLDDDERAFQQQVVAGPQPLGPGAAPLDRLIAYGRARTGFLIDHCDIARAALDGHQPIPAGSQSPLSQVHIRVLLGRWTSAAPPSTCWPSSSLPPWTAPCCSTSP